MGSSHSKARHWTEEGESDEEMDSVVAVELPKKVKTRPFSLAPTKIMRKMSDASSMPQSPTISPPLSSTFTEFASKRTSNSSYWAASIPSSARHPRSPPLGMTSSPSYPPTTSPDPQSLSSRYPPSTSPYHQQPCYFSTSHHRPSPISPRSLTSTTTNTPLNSPLLSSTTRIFRLDPSPTGGTVYAWPSTGGVLIATCTPCELTYLHINDKSERFLDPTEEDEFCRLLRSLGAKRFPSMEAVGSSIDEETVKVGYPENGRGVWVVKLGGRREGMRGREEHVEYLRTVGELRTARRMDERCEVIRRLGGVFYADMRMCEEIN